ncbi:MAG TPA: hypothetical protein VIM75_20700 [Ohtaekwangia sp.]|uniref:hypothetical protein n=2 Tax=Ohtaekwangia sp. TaxID=2066019 RepID=UPI002F93B27E
MKEFMLYMRNEKDAKKSLTDDQHLAFIKKCETYIGILKSENKLIAAQPIVREGVVLKKTENGWAEKDIATDKETQVGYYHILAANLYLQQPLKYGPSKQKKLKRALYTLHK